MERALFLAERGRGTTSPNPMVGAVVVSSAGVIVGQGAHIRPGGAHAEVAALDMAAQRARGATLYCTLEPCAHVGRTGPCVERIVAAGINRIMRAPDKAVLLITHYQRLLDYVKPDRVHVLSKGRIVRSGGPELAHELEREGHVEAAA